MKIIARTAKPLDTQADVLCALVFAPHASKKTGLAAPLAAIDRALRGSLSEALKQEDFTGKKDQTFNVATLGRIKAKKLVVVGLGDPAKITATELRTAFAKIARLANGEKAKTLAIALPDGLEPHFRAIAEGLCLGAYRFTKYLTGDRKPKAHLTQVTLSTTQKLGPSAKRSIDTGIQIAAAVNASRDLSNEPPNVIYPQTLAQAASDMAKEAGLKITILDFKEIKSAACSSSRPWARAAFTSRASCTSRTCRRSPRSASSSWARASPSTPAASASSPPPACRR